MMNFFTSIKGKINTAFSILVAFSIIFIGIYLYIMFNNFYMENLEFQLKEKANIVSTAVIEDLGDNEKIQHRIDTLSEQTENFRFTIIRTDGKVLAESEKTPATLEDHSDRPEIKAALEGKTGINSRYSETLDQDLLYAAVPIVGPDQNEDVDIIAVSRVAVPLEQIQSARIQIGISIISAVLFALALTWIFGSFISHNITRPLANLTDWSKQISKGNFSKDFPIQSNDEIGQLAHHFHEMKINLSELMETLTREKNKLAVLLNNMPDGVIGVDNTKNITLINPAARSLLDIKGDLLYRPIISITRNYTLNKNLDKVLENNTQVTQTVNLDEKVLRVYITPIPEKTDTPSGAVIILQDITDLTKLEQIRKEFISNISHELKTPLTSVQGFIETLQEEIPDDNEQHQEFLEIIKDENLRSTRLIEDLTTLSKLETKPGFVSKAQDNLIPLLSRVISLAKQRWEDQGYYFQSNFSSDEIIVMMDKDKIQQALSNLIDNAVKHNPPGTNITIKTEITDDNKHVKVAVQDDGVGIQAEELPRIFERFYRVEKSRYKDDSGYGGTGLGLSITKHIIEAHDSHLEVKSEPNKGTEFYFYLKII